MNYASVAANSAGTAQKKYTEAYTQGIEAAMNRLTASWEKFSTAILDSKFIVSIVDVLTSIVDVLNGIASIGDGILITIPAISVGLYAIYSMMVKIKTLETFGSIVSGLKSMLAVFPAILATFNLAIAKIRMKIAAHTTATGAIIAETTATRAATAAQKAFNATNPVGWIMIGVTALYALIKVLTSLANARRKASEAAKKEAEAAKELADKAKEEQNSLDELIDKYAEVRNTEYVDSDKRKEIREIQKQINLLVGAEAKNLDLVNDGLDTSLEKLKALKLEEARKKQSTYTANYSAAENNVSSALETDTDAAGWLKWGADLAGYELETSGYDETAKRILDQIDGVIVEEGTNLISRLTIFKFDASGAEEHIDVINNAIAALENDQTYNHWDSEVYNKLVQLRDSYQEYITSVKTAADDLLTNTVSIAGLQKEVEEGFIVDSIDSYKVLQKELESTVMASDDLKKALEEGRVSQEDISAAVSDYMSLNYPDWYNKIAQNTKKAIIAQKDFLKILEEVEGKFDSLQNALKDLDDQGIITASNISKIIESYPELMKYFKLTSQGYVLEDEYSGWSSSDILKDFSSGYLQTYVDELAKCEVGTDNYKIAQENLNTAIAAMATLLRTSAVSDATDAYEKQKDALNEQLDKYKDLIDVRKDLLKTYKEELDYQKELNKKQQSVASLQTQLTLSRLDTSEAGKARSRELEKELEDAQEELDDYTLEHAIDVLTNSIDSEYDEYQKFINSEVDRIEEAIKKIASEIHVSVEIPETTKESDSGESSSSSSGETSSANASSRGHGRYPGNSLGNTYARIYHNGGFVDGVVASDDDEVFAKLLKGEYVSTPSQMSRFVRETLPSIAASASAAGSAVSYNAPLVSIHCDSVTKESMSDLKKIVNQAAQKVKDEIDSAFGRTGYRMDVNKFMVKSR